MSILRKYFWLLGSLILSLPLQLSAQSLNARFTTSFYSWERHLTETVDETHFRIYQTARITVGQLAGNRLSFNFYGQGSQDVAESADEDPIPRLYNAYLQWRERKGIVQRVRLGRQRIYAGVAYGTVDGVDATFRVGKLCKVGGFAGFLVPFSNEIEVGDWEDSRAFGARISTDRLFGTTVLVSFLQRDNRPAPYTSPGRFTQRILTFESLEQRLVGVDLFRNFGRKVSAYGRFDYDIEQERVRRGQVELKFSVTPKLQLSGEFFHRAPLIAANSIFTVFEHNTTQDIGLRGVYQFRQNWFVTGNFGYVHYEGDETVRFGAGVRCKYGQLGYNFRSGYGGQNNGVYATVNYPLTQKLGLLASTGFARYSLFDEDADKRTSLTGSFGFNYRAGKHFSFDFLGQGVRNRFLDSDVRFFVKANYWVFGKLRK